MSNDSDPQTPATPKPTRRGRKPRAQPPPSAPVTATTAASAPAESEEPKKILTPAERWRAALRKAVRAFYDLQRLRMQSHGRTYDRATVIELEPEDVKRFNDYGNFLEQQEKAALDHIKDLLERDGFYRATFSDRSRWKGVGPTMAAVLLSELDIDRARSVSCFWKIAGLAVTPRKRCRVCFVVLKEVEGAGGLPAYEHPSYKCKLSFGLVPPEEQIDSGQTDHATRGEKIAYNPFLKTKVVGVMADCMIKAGSPYRAYYDDYKHRWASAGKGKSDAHRHLAAKRFMVKILLSDLFNLWMNYLGRPCRKPYYVLKLGMPLHVNVEGAPPYVPPDHWIGEGEGA